MHRKERSPFEGQRFNMMRPTAPSIVRRDANSTDTDVLVEDADWLLGVLESCSRDNLNNAPASLADQPKAGRHARWRFVIVLHARSLSMFKKAP